MSPSFPCQVLLSLCHNKLKTLLFKAKLNSYYYHLARARKFREVGKKDEAITLYDVPDIRAQRVILQGLGKLEKIDREALRSMAGNAPSSRSR